MAYDRSFITDIASYTESLLAPLGNRWLHVQEVAVKATTISVLFDLDDGTQLVAAAYLHDIGYAPACKQTEFHPLDGASHVRSLGYPRLASLVAYHSEAIFEARIRGLEPALQAFVCEHSAVADALTYCDQTTGPTGTTVTYEERIAEVVHRYGETHPVAQALEQARPSLSRAVTRTIHRLHAAGLPPVVS